MKHSPVHSPGRQELETPPGRPTEHVLGDARSSPWLEQWFPIAFLEDLFDDSLQRVSVHGVGFVLARTRSGVSAFLDRCPHRGARLSDGRVADDGLECAYHGWRFDAEGACRHVPQLAPGAKPPAGARARRVPTAVRDDIVWIWAGADPAPDEGEIPGVAELEQPGLHGVRFSMDLPYGQDFFLENVLDYAHIHVMHDGVRGGGRRVLAGPLAFDVSAISHEGFEASFGAARDGGMDTGPELSEARVEFRAPNLVHYRSVYRDPERRSGLLLYSMPLAEDRCRLLYRTYTNFAPISDRLRPRFWEHGYQCHLLEQDMAVIAGQARNLTVDEAPLSEQWSPLKGSDALVLAFRSWLDEFRAERPGAIGWRRRGPAVAPRALTGPTDRYTLHTSRCRSCRRALARLTRAAKLFAWGAGIGALAAVLAPDSSGLELALALFAGTAALATVAARALVRRLVEPGPALVGTSDS